MKILGKDPALLIGKVFWEEFPDVPNEEALRRVMSERVAVTDELYYAPWGEWVENRMFPRNDGGLATFQRYITDRKRAEAESEALRDELAAELTAMTRLHELSTPLLASTEFQPLLEEILNAIIALQNADFGNVQLYNPEIGGLEIIAQRGFQPEFLDYFRMCTTTEPPAAGPCGKGGASSSRMYNSIPALRLTGASPPPPAFVRCSPRLCSAAAMKCSACCPRTFETPIVRRSASCD
jgi:hypothetical protein